MKVCRTQRESEEITRLRDISNDVKDKISVGAWHLIQSLIKLNEESVTHFRRSLTNVSSFIYHTKSLATRLQVRDKHLEAIGLTQVAIQTTKDREFELEDHSSTRYLEYLEEMKNRLIDGRSLRYRYGDVAMFREVSGASD